MTLGRVKVNPLVPVKGGLKNREEKGRERVADKEGKKREGKPRKEIEKQGES